MNEKSNARVQWEKLKGEPFSEKMRYVLEYYGIWFGVAAFILVLAVLAIFFSAEKGNQRLAYGIIFDSEATDSRGEIVENVCDWLDKDPKKYTLEFYPMYFDSEDVVNIYDQQEALFGRIASGDLDFMVGSAEALLGYIAEDDPDYCNLHFLDELLPEDLFRDLEDQGRILWTDTSFNNGKSAFLVDVSDSYISKGLDVTTTDLYLGFVCTSKRADVLVAMCRGLAE